MVKLIVERVLWESDTSNRNWTIAKYDDDSFSCSCPAWIFQKGGIRNNCKHIKALIESRKQNTEKEIIGKALKEYEENHWATENPVWQKSINALTERYVTAKVEGIK